MKKVFVFRHVPHEGLGTLETFLSRNHFQIQYLDLFQNSSIPKEPTDCEFVISMGGPMNVDETDRYPFLKLEREFIQKAIQAEKPVLGICLGAQMIARALGAQVYPGPQKEIGWYPIQLSNAALKDILFQAFPVRNPTVFQWHGDTFDLPEGATLLASSRLYPNQAFRYGNSVYALQFHIEITPEMLLDWLLKGDEELHSLTPPILKNVIIQDIPKYGASLKKSAEKMYHVYFSHLMATREKVNIL